MAWKHSAQYAQALYAAHGDQAEAEAAAKMNEAREAGRADEAADWKAVRAAVRSLRGANAS
ncbi:MAG: hypothetical protein P8X50_17375 [Maritimibacter sp.]